MPDLRVYVAASLDGFIATKDGGVAWLDAYNSPDFGFARFFDEVDTLVVGRKTFDQALGFPEWTWSTKRVIVQTRRPLPATLPSPCESFAGDPRALAASLRAEQGKKDVWLVGGGESIRSFLEHDLVDRFEVFVIPVLLGAGVPLWAPRAERSTKLRLVASRAYANGVVGLDHRRA